MPLGWILLAQSWLDSMFAVSFRGAPTVFPRSFCAVIVGVIESAPRAFIGEGEAIAGHDAMKAFCRTKVKCVMCMKET